MQLKTFELSRYNEKSQRFAKDWLLRPNIKILGVKYYKNNDRDEDKVFYRYTSDSWADITKNYVALLPVKNSGGAPVFYGDVDWLARTTFARVFANSKEYFGHGYCTCQKYAWVLDRQRMLRIQRAIQRLIS
jgi:hypothetical protein